MLKDIRPFAASFAVGTTRANWGNYEEATKNGKKSGIPKARDRAKTIAGVLQGHGMACKEADLIHWLRDPSAAAHQTSPHLTRHSPHVAGHLPRPHSPGALWPLLRGLESSGLFLVSFTIPYMVDILQVKILAASMCMAACIR